MTRVEVDVEDWPLAHPFVIARGTKTHASVVVVRLSDGHVEGRGECVPYARYGETVSATAEAVTAAGFPQSHEALRALLPPGAARNALDCALWDLEAKQRGTRVHVLLGRAPPEAVQTCYTLSLGEPGDMAARASAVADLKLLKLKLGGAGDAERLRAVRRARPDARLVADANESWTVDMLEPLLGVAAECGIELVEQPLPAGADAALARVTHHVPVCADESVHTSADLAGLTDRYDAINIKLDKAGGLTEAIAMSTAAHALGLRIMVGCMVATSLAMAPALLVAADADWVDLDGPLLLARDRPSGLLIANGVIAPPGPDLWG